MGKRKFIIILTTTQIEAQSVSCSLFRRRTITAHSRPLYLPLIMIISLPLYWFHLADSLYLHWEMNLHFCICSAVFSISQSKLSLLGYSICQRGYSILEVIWLHWSSLIWDCCWEWPIIIVNDFSNDECVYLAREKRLWPIKWYWKSIINHLLTHQLTWQVKNT